MWDSRRADASKAAGGRRGDSGAARQKLTFHGIALRVIEVVEVSEVLVGERLHRELLHRGPLDQNVVVLWSAPKPADPLRNPSTAAFDKRAELGRSKKFSKS